jgi:hypothetical protein
MVAQLEIRDGTPWYNSQDIWVVPYRPDDGCVSRGLRWRDGEGIKRFDVALVAGGQAGVSDREARP